MWYQAKKGYIYMPVHNSSGPRFSNIIASCLMTFDSFADLYDSPSRPPGYVNF